jgi:hypothetical protein
VLRSDLPATAPHQQIIRISNKSCRVPPPGHASVNSKKTVYRLVIAAATEANTAAIVSLASAALPSRLEQSVQVAGRIDS